MRQIRQNKISSGKTTTQAVELRDVRQVRIGWSNANADYKKSFVSPVSCVKLLLTCHVCGVQRVNVMFNELARIT